MQNTNVALAPAAGAGIGRMLFDLLLADPEFLPAMKEAAIGGLRAVQTFRDRQSGELVRQPDFKTRIQALSMLLAQAEGDPIKRVIHQHLGAEGQLDVFAAMKESPALREAVRRELDKAEHHLSGRGAGPGRPKKVQSVALVELPE